MREAPAYAPSVQGWDIGDRSLSGVWYESNHNPDAGFGRVRGGANRTADGERYDPIGLVMRTGVACSTPQDLIGKRLGMYDKPIDVAKLIYHE